MATIKYQGDPVLMLQELIRCPSVTPNEGGALDLLQRWLEQRDFICTRLPFGEVDNLYARRGKTGKNFCFAGHTDVVPAGDESLWDHPPFSGHIIGDEIWGRGATDMKGGIACFVAAVDRLLQRGNCEESISLLITGDEEGPAVNGTVKVLEWLEKNGEKLNHCVVGEPTNPEAMGDMVKVGRRGSLTGHLTVKGKQGHVAYPHRADNPIHPMIEMLHNLTSEPLDEGTDLFQASSLQVVTCDVGNTTNNVIPSEARATFNVRFNDLYTAKSLEAWITHRLGQVGHSYSVEFSCSGESFSFPPGELGSLVADACEEVTGLRPEYSTSGGTSDARFIKNYCPVAEFGAVGKTMHNTNERASVEDLETLTLIYLELLKLYFG
jgi:succinyl-diaminopimelate desuccinylase